MAGPDLMFHDPAVVPGTHALVIGIGQYPHLIGGSAPATKTDGLRQLSSPPISARAVADWLASEYHWPAAPLASLSLMVSAAEVAPFTGPHGVAHPVPTADIATLSAAVQAWKARGDTHPGNRMIFYFCGHGTSQGEDMALLAQDFSLDDPNPLQNALDFRQLVNGLRTCAAEQQIFLVDACRASSDVLIRQSGGMFAGQVPVLGGGLPRREAITYYASLAGELSHARPNQVSLFTEATLRALRGAGSDNPGGGDEWMVTTSRLHEAVVHFIKQPSLAGRASEVQNPGVNAMPIYPVHQLAAPPVVPVYVGCDSLQENEVAEFVCRRGGVERSRRQVGALDPADPEGRWLLDLDLGDYEFEAKVAADDVRVITRTARPLFLTVKLGRTP